MQYVPRRHQQIADDFLKTHDRGILLLDMGLGKTVITLTHLHRLIYEEFTVDKALVIAPKRVAEDTWSREAAKWEHLSGLRIVKVLGDRRTRLEALRQKGDIFVTNRENVEWLVETLGANFDFDCVVIDELSSFKSAKAKRWKALRKVIFRPRYVYGLTGTPAPNGYLDLWPEIYLFDRGERLGRTLTAYRTEYFTPGAHRGHVVYDWRMKPGAKQRIDRLLSDICISMSKEDWLSLPERSYVTVPVQLDAKARKLYERFKTDHIIPLIREARSARLKAQSTEEDYDSAVIGDMAAQVSGKLLQMANGAVYDENGDVFRIHDAKLDALEDILEAANGQPVLCFYIYKHDLDRIRERFPFAVKLRDSETISAWNRGEIPLLLCQPASAGHGLNLQEGGHIIAWFGMPWSLELYQQANDRLHRFGQTQSVIVHHLVAQDTLDEKVLQVLTAKDATQRGLLNALKNYIDEEMNDI